MCVLFFFFNDTATTEIYTLSLHDALPIWIPGNHDDDGTAVRLERGPQQIHARDGRDVEIDEHDIKARPLEQLQRVFAVPAQRDMEALMLQHRRTALAQRPFVVDEEDAQPRLLLGAERRPRCRRL